MEIYSKKDLDRLIINCKDGALLRKYVLKLQHQLEEKDKVINEMYDKINDLYYGNFFSNEKPIKFSYTEIGKELLEILERGKNGK